MTDPVDGTSADRPGDPASGRLAGLVDDLAALHPGSTVSVGRRLGRPGPAERRFRLLLNTRRPWAVVPDDVPSAAGPFLRRTSANDAAVVVLGRRLVGSVAGGPLRSVAFPTCVSVRPAPVRGAGQPVADEPVEHWLAERLGTPVRVALAAGADRANAKPVLGVTRLDGTEIGFAKVGLTTLAQRLVRHETAVLRRLADADLASVVVPPVLAAGTWASAEVLLMGAVRGTLGSGRTLPVAAMRELAGLGGVIEHPFDTSPWVQEVARRCAAVPGRLGQRLRRIVAAVGSGTPSGPARTASGLLHGTWHGDWGPWNMAWDVTGSGPDAQADPRVALWDWERCTGGVPIGLDAVHFTAHAKLRRVGDLDAALAVLRDRAEPAVTQVLRGWADPSGAERAAPQVVDAYLVEVASRFAADSAEVPSDAVQRVAGWFADVAEHRLGLITEPADDIDRRAGQPSTEVPR